MSFSPLIINLNSTSEKCPSMQNWTHVTIDEVHGASFAAFNPPAAMTSIVDGLGNETERRTSNTLPMLHIKDDAAQCTTLGGSLPDFRLSLYSQRDAQLCVAS
jgi:hypothetical protein